MHLSLTERAPLPFRNAAPPPSAGRLKRADAVLAALLDCWSANEEPYSADEEGCAATLFAGTTLAAINVCDIPLLLCLDAQRCFARCTLCSSFLANRVYAWASTHRTFWKRIYL